MAPVAAVPVRAAAAVRTQASGLRGSTGAPPRTHQRVVVFSMETELRRTSLRLLGERPCPICADYELPMFVFQRLDRDQYQAEQPHAVHRRDKQHRQSEHREQLRPIVVLSDPPTTTSFGRCTLPRTARNYVRGRDHELLSQRQRLEARCRACITSGRTPTASGSHDNREASPTPKSALRRVQHQQSGAYASITPTLFATTGMTAVTLPSMRGRAPTSRGSR